MAGGYRGGITSGPSQGQTGIASLITGLAEGYGAGQDQDAKLKQAYQQQMMKQNSPSGGLGGRAMASLIGGLLTPAEKNRMDSLESFIPLHNQITDAIVAIQAGNPKPAEMFARGFVARYPEASGYFHGGKIDLNSLASIYNTLSRMGAVEQFKMILGSNAMPTEEAIAKNQKGYPSYTEIANRSPAVPAKLNALTETMGHAVIAGPMERIDLYRNEDGSFMTPYHSGMHKQLNKRSENFRNRLRRLPDSGMDKHGQIPVPGFTGVAPMGDSPVVIDERPAAPGGGMAGSPADQGITTKKPKTADEYEY